jgi:hypothetical protein
VSVRLIKERHHKQTSSVEAAWAGTAGLAVTAVAAGVVAVVAAAAAAAAAAAKAGWDNCSGDCPGLTLGPKPKAGKPPGICCQPAGESRGETGPCTAVSPLRVVAAAAALALVGAEGVVGRPNLRKTSFAAGLATISAVLPRLSRRLGLAPSSNSRSRAPRDPAVAAKCIAVEPTWWEKKEGERRRG